MKFKGRKVFRVSSKKYPAVWWPNHPVAFENGIAEVHRIVAFERWGEKVLDLEVHHRDGNVDNWHPSNLKLLTKSDHAKKHAKDWECTEKTKRTSTKCEECEREFTSLPSANRKYCSPRCFHKSKEKINWPSTEWLEKMANKYSFKALERRLGVSANAIRKRIKNH